MEKQKLTKLEKMALRMLRGISNSANGAISLSGEDREEATEHLRGEIGDAELFLATIEAAFDEEA